MHIAYSVLYIEHGLQIDLQYTHVRLTKFLAVSSVRVGQGKVTKNKSFTKDLFCNNECILRFLQTIAVGVTNKALFLLKHSYLHVELDQ